MRIVSSVEMREIDRKMIQEDGIPASLLMERAGTGAGREILEFVSELHHSHVRRFVILAGRGNNGGDAYVVARFLDGNSGVPVHVFAVCPTGELSGDALANAKRLPQNVFCEVRRELNPDEFSKGDIIIDGLLGTGGGGAPRAPYSQWIKTINALHLPVVSLDIPSGLDGNTGEAAGEAVRADLTVTIGLPKRGLAFGCGPELCGRIRCVDIGIPEKYIAEKKADIEMIFAEDVRKFLPRVDMNVHKGARGRVLVIAGSLKYRGAPFLSARAAFRTGAGLVFLAVPESVHSVRLPAALIFRKVSDGGKGVFSSASIPELRKLAEDADAVVFGPGVTDHPSVSDVLRFVSSLEKPVVFDADALNIIARKPEFAKRKFPAVLTPHAGEMRRLLEGFGLGKYLDADRLTQSLKLAEETGSVVVLKGHRTITAYCNGGLSPAINSSGSPALATAGSGDVLSGMIGTFIAQGLGAFDASVSAVFIHGLAGESEKFGVRGLTSDDLIDLIPDAMKRISPFA